MQRQFTVLAPNFDTQIPKNGALKKKNLICIFGDHFHARGATAMIHEYLIKNDFQSFIKDTKLRRCFWKSIAISLIEIEPVFGAIK